MTQDSTQHFIATIEADRDQKVAQIQADAESEIKQIFGDAHERSRQLQHDTNARLRHELSNRRQKETSRIRARLRRQLWQRVKQLQHDIKQQVLDRMQAAWRDQEWQWDWCHFWLKSASLRGDKVPLSVEISKSVSPGTLERIRRWAEQNEFTLELEATLEEPGLVICWLDFELDGLISAQSRTIDNEVLARLAPLMPQLHQVDTP